MRWNKPEPEAIPDGHPSQEHRDMHPGDMKLRRAGYKIHSRPKWQEATWVKGGAVMPESLIHRHLEYLEEIHRIEQTRPNLKGGLS